jgi:hypothetical protein
VFYFVILPSVSPIVIGIMYHRRNTHDLKAMYLFILTDNIIMRSYVRLGSVSNCGVSQTIVVFMILNLVNPRVLLSSRIG